ncbi:MAG: ATP synthase F1 subunit delta [Ruminococcus sp.]|nr:ATP synthase F1 subunit delta [Ruminococcus sp.]
MAESVKNVYAEALFQLCEERGITAEADEELDGIRELFSANEEYTRLLSSPLVGFDEKKKLLSAAFEGKVSDTVFDFLCVVTEKGRAGFTAEICREFRRLFYIKQGILEVSVVTAMPLSEALADKLKAKLESTLNKKIIMHTEVDKGLIGGIIVRYEGAELDSSVRGRLDRLKSQIDGIIA